MPRRVVPCTGRSARSARGGGASYTRLNGARRSLLQRVAGSGRRVALAWRDHEALYLPERLAVLPTRALNRELYFWLAALAAVQVPAEASDDWLAGAQRRTLAVLERYPGLRARYLRLVQAYLPLRPEPARLATDAAAQERVIRAALCEPGSVAALPRRTALPHRSPCGCTRSRRAALRSPVPRCRAMPSPVRRSVVRSATMSRASPPSAWTRRSTTAGYSRCAWRTYSAGASS